MTQSGYIRLLTSVEFGMGISDTKLLFCHGITEQSRKKIISMRYCNNRKVYDFFKNQFTVDCGSPALNLPTMPLDKSFRPNKILLCTLDHLPGTISVASGNSVSPLTFHS